MSSHELHGMRREYSKYLLTEQTLPSNPLDILGAWMEEAIVEGLNDPNAMVLATASSEGIPSARVVLLKGLSQEGLVFFTNYHSHKGRDLEENPNAAALFYWQPLERQVRVQGIVERLGEELSDEYFQSRPLESRISAVASPQSQVIGSREHLEELWAEAYRQISEGSLTRPAHWGGYLIRPQRFEFWQGRENRLHDRLQYILDDGVWKMSRLAP